MGNTQKGPADPPTYSAFLSPSPAPIPAPPPLKSAPNVAPSLIFTPPPPPSGSLAPPFWAPPRNLVAPPQISPSYAPAPLIFPHAVALQSKVIRHHYALIAGAAAAVFLALLVLGVLVLKRKKLPECIRADKNGRPQEASVEVKSEVVAGASENANAKKDLGSNGNSNHEDYVITLNVYSSPGHGRRRANVPPTVPADLTCDRTDGLEKQGVVASASGGAPELRTDELSKSGRSLGERNRDARSVRTRNFAAPRTN